MDQRSVDRSHVITRLNTPARTPQSSNRPHPSNLAHDALAAGRRSQPVHVARRHRPGSTQHRPADASTASIAVRIIPEPALSSSGNIIRG